MASLSQGKTLGEIGSILVFIPLVSLIGYVLLLLAGKEISDSLREPRIFRNILIGTVSGLIGAVVAAILVVSGIVSAFFTLGLGAVLGVIGGLLVFWAFQIVSAFFVKKAYDEMAQRLGVDTFATSALVNLIGAVLTIVLIGFLLIFVANIIQAIAYFSITTTAANPSAASSQTGQPMISATPADFKFCPSCGAKIPAGAVSCSSCGTQQLV